LFCENNRSSVMEKRESIELKALIDAYAAEPTPENRRPLCDYARRMAAIEKDLTATVDNRALLKEIAPWSRKLALYGEACLLAIDIEDPESPASRTERWTQWNNLRRRIAQLDGIPQEVCGKVPERLLQRAALTGMGLGVPLVSPAAVRGADPDLTLDSISTSTLELIADGNLETSFHSTRPVGEGDWIQVSFPAPRPVGEIRAFFCNPKYIYEFPRAARLETTADGATWKTELRGDPLAGKSNPMELRVAIDPPRPVLSARICFEGEPETALVVREFQLIATDRPTISGTLAETNAPGVDAVQDGSIASAFRLPNGVRSGQTLDLSFAAAIPVRQIAIYQTENEFLQNAAIEYTTDGRRWIEAGQIQSPAVEADLGGRAIRGVRLRAKEDQKTPVAIHEIVLIDKEGRRL